MAVTQIHVRSKSLPSRLNPINSIEFEAEQQKLKSTTTSATSDSIQSGLLGLAELYNSINELTQSTSTQQSIKDARLIIDDSLELLDSCSTIRELVQIMKENVRALQSALRRKGLDSGIQNDVASYIWSRKKMNKCIKKSLKTLKNSYKKINESSLSGDRQDSLVRALREMHGLTISIFRGALLFLSSSAVGSGGWNVMSRLLMINKSADHESVVTEVGCVDLAVHDLRGRVRNGECKIVDNQMVQKSLQNLDSCIVRIEAGLERMFRQLLQSRVNLLNNFVTNH